MSDERGGRKDVNGKRRVRGEEGERGILKGGERREGKEGRGKGISERKDVEGGSRGSEKREKREKREVDKVKAVRLRQY